MKPIEGFAEGKETLRLTFLPSKQIPYKSLITTQGEEEEFKEYKR